MSTQPTTENEQNFYKDATQNCEEIKYQFLPDREREKAYADILIEYASHQKKTNEAQRIYKCHFFIMICVVFVTVVAVCLAAICHTMKEPLGLEHVGIIASSITGIITAIVVLPQKIADNLFPKDGDKHITEFIAEMHRMDVLHHVNITAINKMNKNSDNIPDNIIKDYLEIISPKT